MYKIKNGYIGVISLVLLLGACFASFNLSSTNYNTGDSYVTYNYDLTDTDYSVLGGVATLAMVAVIFAYLSSKAASYLWEKLWIFFFCLSVMGCLMLVNLFAADSGNTVISNIAYILLYIFVFILIFSIWVLITELYKEFVIGLVKRK